MEKLQITKGEYTFSPQKGKPGKCFTAQIWDVEGKNLAILEATYNEAEINSFAEIMTDSLNVYSETEKLPSELLRQNREMREALIKIKDEAKVLELPSIFFTANECLTSCTEQGKE